jgi:hypothetical protein
MTKASGRSATTASESTMAAANARPPDDEHHAWAQRHTTDPDLAA